MRRGAFQQKAYRQPLRRLTGQRVGIAQALIHTPLLVVLDEPTNGLDPNQILEVRQLIKEIAADRARDLSSHILSEIQATCQDIIMIEGGKIVFKDTMESFNNYIEPDSLIATLENPPPEAELRAIKGIKEVEFLTEKTIRVTIRACRRYSGETSSETSVHRKWRLKEITLEKSSLDAIFAQLSNKKTKPAAQPA